MAAKYDIAEASNITAAEKPLGKICSDEFAHRVESKMSIYFHRERLSQKELSPIEKDK